MVGVRVGVDFVVPLAGLFAVLDKNNLAICGGDI